MMQKVKRNLKMETRLIVFLYQWLFSWLIGAQSRLLLQITPRRGACN
jgi:hypothetical protein